MRIHPKTVYALTALFILLGCGDRPLNELKDAAETPEESTEVMAEPATRGDSFVASTTTASLPASPSTLPAGEKHAPDESAVAEEDQAPTAVPLPGPTISAEEATSTFSIDVDTASYAFARSLLQWDLLPRPADVRIEEFVNYFAYDYAPPTDGAPFAVHSALGAAPWAEEETHLLKIGLKGREIDLSERPASNLIFLLDVSGSMMGENKLPLIKHGVRQLTEQLGEEDRVAIVVYAGASGLVLPPRSGEDKEEIYAALENLSAGGSTNGSAGIELAYEVAARHFIPGGNNRVILGTDGDFNVGITDWDELIALIAERAASGIDLSVLGVGMSSSGDTLMEGLADHGNGNYAYIDSTREAHKVLVEEMAGTILTIAADVKIQLTFDPSQVKSYRLIGYENRRLANEDFANDAKDAGELGSGHTVTALYEVTLTPEAEDNPGELFSLRLRYKEPGEKASREMVVVSSPAIVGGPLAGDFAFAAAVAALALKIRHSTITEDFSFQSLCELAVVGLGRDPHGYRQEFLGLAGAAAALLGEEADFACVATKPSDDLSP